VINKRQDNKKFTADWIYTTQSTHNPAACFGSLKTLEPRRCCGINIKIEAFVEI